MTETIHEDMTLDGLHAAYEKRAFARECLVQLTYCVIALCEESGEIAGKVKKALRDDGGRITPERGQAIAEEVADVLFYLDWVAYNLGYSLQECYEIGAKKFDSRKARGTLHGEGDGR